MIVLPTTSEGIETSLSILHAGGIVIHPTETCYGIACDLTNPDALQKLFDLKKRPYSQPVSALFSSLDAAKAYVVFSPRALTEAEKHLPGPLTLVLPKKDSTPTPIHVCPRKFFTLHSSLFVSIGVRISSHPFAMQLAEAFGRPIATTSANLHGEANPYSVKDIDSQWATSSLLPDLVIDSGILPIAPPSTVVEILGDSIRVLRQGDVVVT